MSIDYTTGIFYGYPVTEEEFEKIEEMFSDFGTYCDIAHMINAWTGEGGYFFGYCIKTIDDNGGVIPLNNLLDFKIPDDKEFKLNAVISMLEKAGLTPRESTLNLVTLVY